MIRFYHTRSYHSRSQDAARLGIGRQLFPQESSFVPPTRKPTHRMVRTKGQGSATIEHAQEITNHESPRTTRGYDRTSDAISLDEVRRRVDPRLSDGAKVAR